MNTGKVLAFGLTFMTYVALHSLREGWSYSKSQIQSQLQIDKAYFGVVDTCYLFSYSIGMATLGNLSKTVKLNLYISFGMIGATLSYLSFIGVYIAFNFWSMILVGIMMSLNGFCQSTGWPGMMGVIGNWFGKGKRGLMMAFWSVNANVGNIMALVVCNLLQHNLNLSWIYNFIFTGIFTLFIALLVLFFLKEAPPQPTHYLLENEQKEEALRLSVLTDQKATQSPPLDNQDVSVLKSLCLPRVPYYVVGYACLKGCTYGLLFWLPSYLDQKNLSSQKGYISAMIDVGSFIGGLIVGHLGDRYQLRALFLSPLLILSSAIMFIVSYALTDIAWMYYIAIFGIGVAYGGPYNIIGSAIAIDLGQQTGGKNVSTVSALIQGSAAVFAALSQIILSIIPYEWVFYVFSAECILASIALLPLFFSDLAVLRQRNRKKTEQKLY